MLSEARVDHRTYSLSGWTAADLRALVDRGVRVVDLHSFPEEGRDGMVSNGPALTLFFPRTLDFMSKALEGKPETTMNRPDGIVDRLVNKSTGELATPGQPNTMFEYFRDEFAPAPLEPQMPGIDITEEESEELSTETIF